MPYEAAQRGRKPGLVQSGAHTPAPIHTVDSKRGQVIVKFGKKLKARDIAEYVGKLVANPAFRSDFSEIVDLREVEELDLDAQDFIRLADEVDPFSETAKRAFVVQSSSQNHAARMHKILRTHRTIEIFRSMEDAQRWICS